MMNKAGEREVGGCSLMTGLAKARDHAVAGRSGDESLHPFFFYAVPILNGMNGLEQLPAVKHSYAPSNFRPRCCPSDPEWPSSLDSRNGGSSAGPDPGNG